MLILRKKSNKKTSTENGNDNLIRDVTIEDFANSSRKHARFKKAAANVFSEVEGETTTDKDSWTGLGDNYECAPGDTKKTQKHGKGRLASQRRNGQARSSEETVQEEAGIDYPLDIWFIISEYISPEAVGKFARICKSSYLVTTTGKFWFDLYKSYYRYVPGLPERLQPECMVRTYGLRACVIRTLHYTYFAVKKQDDDASYLRSDEPHSLVKRRCTLMWHKKGKMRWYFYFKLKEIQRENKNRLKPKMLVLGKKTDFIEMLEDVAVNPEEGCRVLRVTCLKYSMLPPVIGLILQTVSMTLMPGFKHHRLQLGFGTSDIPNTLTNQVILTDVLDCQILDWWDPTYPHENGINAIELPQIDSWDQSLL